MMLKPAILILLGSMLTLLAVESRPPAIKVLAKGAFSGIQEPSRIVVTNETQWAELWQKHTAKKEPKTAAPQVDFNRNSVVFVSLGQKKSGGYAVEIVDVRRSGDRTVVVLKETAPKPGGFQLAALTAPFVVAEIPKIEGTVEFRTEQP